MMVNISSRNHRVLIMSSLGHIMHEWPLEGRGVGVMPSYPAIMHRCMDFGYRHSATGDELRGSCERILNFIKVFYNGCAFFNNFYDDSL